MNEFEARVVEATGQALHGVDIETLQVNLGLCCNNRCRHCHVEASPDRSESMDWPTMVCVIEAARRAECCLVDLTGGAPELNPHFRRLVGALRADGRTVQVRTNLTVLMEPGMESMPEFLRDARVKLVGSMPCYLEENVCAQRGDGVYEKSVAAIRRLNELGYGADPQLALDLVYNPGGAFLPPGQAELEEDYRRELAERFDIAFTHLLTIANMPIGRFRAELAEGGDDEEYMELLRGSFNPATVDALMCRHQVSVRWDGVLHDCDFNLALGYPLADGCPAHVRDFDPAALASRRICTAEHCFGCTAGQGSSCRGALA